MLRPEAGPAQGRLSTAAHADQFAVHGRRPVRWLGAAIALAPVLLYGAIGSLLAFVFNVILWDSWSRVASAYFVVFSRDPHLAAIGFVWNPLPTVALLPFMPLQLLAPGLVREGFAANTVSALFMGAAVWQLWRILNDLNVRRVVACTLTLMFAVHPLIAFFGANGMSEAAFLFFLLLTARHLALWLREGTTQALAMTAVGLALGYLTRQEAVAPAAATFLGVAAVTFTRSSGGRKQRLTAATADLLVVGAPFVFAFTAWALASWAIVGSPFEQFTSAYSISAQRSLIATDVAYNVGAELVHQVRHLVQQVFGLAPAVAPMALVAFAVALRRRDPHVAAIILVFGSVLAFTALAFLTGRTFGWLRYYIAVIPMLFVLAGCALSQDPLAGRRSKRATSSRRERLRAASRPIASAVGTALILAATALSIPSAARTMLDPELNRGDDGIQFLSLMRAGASEDADVTAYDAGGAVARYLDDKGLPTGAVLVDVASGLSVVLHSADPKQFVITTDRDFEAALADPVAFDVQYLLVPAPQGQHDALTSEYPGLYQNGAEIADLEWEFDPPGMFDWRLFKVTSPAAET